MEHGQGEQQQTDSDRLLEQSQATNEKSGKADDDGQSSMQGVSGNAKSKIVQAKANPEESPLLQSNEDGEESGETAEEREKKDEAEASGSEEKKSGEQAEEDVDGEPTDQKEEEQVQTTNTTQTQLEPGAAKSSFYDLLEQQLDTAALTAKFDSSVVSRIRTWEAQIELTHEQKDNIIQKFLSAFDTIHLAADDEQLVELLMLAKKFTDHFGPLHKDLLMGALCKKYIEMKDNSFQALDRHFSDFSAELTGLIKNLSDHQTVNKDEGQLDQHRDKLYWLLLLNPPEVLYRLLSHSLVNSGIVPVVNKILANFPSLFALCTVNRETTRPFNKEPLLISVICRIFEADPERWKQEEQRTNVIYMVQSLIEQLRVESDPKQLASFYLEYMPSSPLLSPADLYCLFMHRVGIVDAHLGIMSKLLHKQDHHSERQGLNSGVNRRVSLY